MNRRGFFGMLAGLVGLACVPAKAKAEVGGLQSRWHVITPNQAREIRGLPPLDPTDAEIAELERKFLARYQGEAKYGPPIVLKPGMKIEPRKG